VLAIEVEYLMGRVYAADYRDSSVSEWPPSPSRLFSALVAALSDRSGSPAERAALAWLAMQGAPCIAAEPPGEGNAVITHVPTNYPSKAGSTQPEQRGKQPRSFPAQGPASPVVHFVWPEAEPSNSVRDALAELAARVPALGRACSLVRVGLTDVYRAPNYIPDDSGDTVLRVFGAGRLEELETLYKLDQRPNAAPHRRYRHIDGFQQQEPVAGCFKEMVIFKRANGIGLPIEAVLTLVDATRNALLKLADGHGLMSGMLSGHGAHPHCAFVALPFAGYPHASGKLMGVAVILPGNIQPAERRKVLRTCALLERINLREVLGSWEVEIANFDVAQITLRPATWTGPLGGAAIWSTVTPILLDRFPKKNLSVEEILRTACERAGLPLPVRVEHGAFSQLEGVPSVPEFRLIRKANERTRWGVHATLEFGCPVKGPLLIGAGRYFGLGLMKPFTAGRDDS
jgi:CRISPR-associated protein Csb2